MIYRGLQSIYETTQVILDNAQPFINGGIFDRLLNDNDDKSLGLLSRVKAGVFETLTSGNYAAALACGIVWLMFFIILDICISVSSCLKAAGRSKGTRITHAIQRRFHVTFNSKSVIFYVIMCIYFILCTLTLVGLLLAFFGNHMLHANLSASPESADNEAVFPRLSRSISSVDKYLRDFAPHGRAAAQPFVNEAINRTAQMQSGAKERFSDVIRSQIGAAGVFNNATVMTEKVCYLFQVQKQLEQAQSDLSSIFLRLEFAGNQDPPLFDCPTGLSDARRNVCENVKSNATVLLSKVVYINLGKKLKHLFDEHISNGVNQVTTFVTNFVNKNNTCDSLKKKLREGDKKRIDMAEELNRRASRELNSTELILNITAEKFDSTENKMLDTAAKVGNITAKLFSNGYEKVRRIEIIRHVVFVVVILIGCFILIVIALVGYWYYKGTPMGDVKSSSYWSKGFMLKLIALLSVPLLCIVLIITMVLFLLSGFVQTEVCRYITPGAAGPKYLDGILNRTLLSRWDEITAGLSEENDTNAMAIPKPEVLLTGITEGCLKDKPIFLALDAVKNFNTSGAPDHPLAIDFKRRGRRLAIDGISEMDENKLLEPGMLAKLKLLLELATKLQLYNYTNDIFLINSRLANNVSILFANATKALEETSEPMYHIPSVVRDNIQVKIVEIAKATDKINSLTSILTSVESATDLTDCVKGQIDSLTLFQKYLRNKTLLVATANSLYTRVIEQGTKGPSEEIMADVSIATLRVMGPCRPLYDGYAAAVGAVCRSIGYPIKVLWFSLGWCLLLISVVLVMSFLFLSRNESMYSPAGALNEHVNNLEMQYMLHPTNNGQV